MVKCERYWPKAPTAPDAQGRMHATEIFGGFRVTNVGEKKFGSYVKRVLRIVVALLGRGCDADVVPLLCRR